MRLAGVAVVEVAGVAERRLVVIERWVGAAVQLLDVLVQGLEVGALDTRWRSCGGDMKEDEVTS